MKTKEKDGLHIEIKNVTDEDVIKILSNFSEPVLSEDEEQDFEVFYQFSRKHLEMPMIHQLANLKVLTNMTLQGCIREMKKLEELRNNVNSKTDS